MELHSHFSNFTFMAISVLSLLVLFKILKSLSSSKTSNTNLPPGPWTLPFIGNIHQIISSSLPHHSLKNLAQKYGPLMFLKLGEVPYIIVSSPEIAKDIMKTHDLSFCDRPNLMTFTIFSYNATDIIFSAFDEHWRQLRKMCVMELLSVKRVQSFRSIREEEVLDLVKSITASEGSVVNLSHKVFEMTFGITARAAFGKRSKHQEAFRSALDEMLTLMGGFCIADLYPSIKILQKMSTVKKKYQKLHNEIDMIMQDIIDEHQSIQREPGRDEDIVDALLKIQHENEHSQHRITDVTMKSIILVSLQLTRLFYTCEEKKD